MQIASLVPCPDDRRATQSDTHQTKSLVAPFLGSSEMRISLANTRMTFPAPHVTTHRGSSATINNRLFLPKRDRGDRPGGVRPNAVDSSQLLGGVRQNATKVLDNESASTLDVTCRIESTLPHAEACWRGGSNPVRAMLRAHPPQRLLPGRQ